MRRDSRSRSSAWLACRPDVAVDLPRAAVVFPYDDVFAAVGYHPRCGKKSVVSDFDGRIAMGFRFDGFEACFLDSDIYHALPERANTCGPADEVTVRRQELTFRR